jgi:hypothetical protein
MVERELIVGNGIILRKYFLDVSQDEQRRRFEARISDPVKHWKLSPMDTESAMVGLHGCLPAYDRGHPHTRGALAYRSGRRQAPRPAESDSASARQYTLQEGRYRLAEDTQGAAATERCYRGPAPGGANRSPVTTENGRTVPLTGRSRLARVEVRVLPHRDRPGFLWKI